MIFAGIDAGSRTIKIVFLNVARRSSLVARHTGHRARVTSHVLQIVAKGLMDQGVEQDKLVSKLFSRLLRDNHIDRKDVGRIVATGYGRYAVSIADTTITEITCHAVGVRQLIPQAQTIIDIGGQDSKLIRLNTEMAKCVTSL